eukprot:TRINITY_DN6_c0_g1_i9.p1 TRINITY_DN6_c0_g1~~TRINITY_DN6_c0_g1_i9.p1  ORF type:complete len:384 (-),score=66.53 TRINITY_DN6_c0_g1_i9:404-1555(-)
MIKSIFSSYIKGLTNISKYHIWNNVKEPEPDPILGIVLKFIKSQDKRKVNLSIGAYRDQNGKPYIFECVKKASKYIVEQNMDHEYYAQGIPYFLEEALKLGYGKDFYAKNKANIAKVQSVSGSGALRLAFTYMKKALPPNRTVYLPNKTWSIHIQQVQDIGLPLKFYDYYDQETKLVNEERMLESIEAIPPGQIILLHACCHNPTGSDISKEGFQKILEIVKQKGHLSLIDMAYQGFASGDLETDGYAPRLFAQAQVPMILTQSFAKNMGLYGERAGLVSVLSNNPKTADNIEVTILNISRPIWGLVPIHGARLAGIVMSKPELYEQWKEELQNIVSNINSSRQQFVQELQKLDQENDWSYFGKPWNVLSFWIEFVVVQKSNQ